MCLNLNERKFDRSEDSDKNLTMHATKIFNEILDKVKMSNLNFCIQMSPFSANISLKKSFIKDKSGAYILPSTATYLGHNNDQQYEIIWSQNQKLLMEINELKSVNKKLAEDLAVVKKELDSLETHRSNDTEGKEDILYTSSQENLSQDKLIADLRQENCHLNCDKDKLTCELNTLKKSLFDRSESCRTLQENIEKLTSEAEISKIAHENKLDMLRQEYKSEIREMNRAIKSRDMEIVELQEKLIIQPNPSRKCHVQTQTVSNVCMTCETQTDHHPDIPYTITDPLPPIFSKVLKRRTPKLAFLPSSCPDLRKVCWSDIDPYDYPLLFSDSDYDDYFEQGKS